MRSLLESSPGGRKVVNTEAAAKEFRRLKSPDLVLYPKEYCRGRESEVQLEAVRLKVVTMATPVRAGSTVRNPGCGGTLMVTVTDEDELDPVSRVAVRVNLRDEPAVKTLGGKVSPRFVDDDEPGRVLVIG